MISPRSQHAFLSALAAVAALAAPAAAQTTQPATQAQGTTVEPAIVTTKPARPIAQPPEFVRLAAKARNLKAVYIKGVAIFERQKEGQGPAEPQRIELEIWAKPPAAKMKLAVPLPEERLSDGKFVYTFRRTNDGGLGRRRRLAAENYYHALETAAVVCDAATGYKNLAAAVRFTPIEFECRHAKHLGELKWFRLDAATKPPHHLLRDTRSARVGISAADGLVRVLVGELEYGQTKATVTVIFETVRQAPISAADFTLPADAADAKWEDADTREPIPAPKQIIQKAAP